MLQKRYEVMLAVQKRAPAAAAGVNTRDSFNEFARINCDVDDDRVRRILEIDLYSQRLNTIELKNEFYKAVMSPVQTGCKLLKKVGESRKKGQKIKQTAFHFFRFLRHAKNSMQEFVPVS